MATVIPRDASTDPAERMATAIAPRPQDLDDIGLSVGFLSDLAEKHLFEGGVLTIRDLAGRMALSGVMTEEIVGFLRKEGRVEVRAHIADELGLRFGLTERGRGSALAAQFVSGYVGPVPVPLEQYERVVSEQSVRSRTVDRKRMHAAFGDTVLDPSLLDRLGPALNSGKAIFVYGLPGTGKTFITQRLARLFDDICLVPHAIAIGDTVVRIYDSSVHRRVEVISPGPMLNRGHDPRFVVCRRPVVITGGELTAEMLEIQFDPQTRQYSAPLQLKANGGIFILDDLGRQRVPPATVLNRWIVPMEECVDYLGLNTGQHFRAPFDVVLVFSTNLQPEALVDDAFLRRIGYKVRFQSLTPPQYHSIWRRVCEDSRVHYDAGVCQFVIDSLHEPSGTPLLPCHPRDLIGIALDRIEYLGGEPRLGAEVMQWAWQNYFVNSEGAAR